MIPGRKLLTAVLLLGVIHPLACAAEPPGLGNRFPLGVYWPWERTAGLAKRNGVDKWDFVERCLDNLKRQGFDAVWAVNLGIPDLPGLAQRMAARDMQLVPALGELHYNVQWRRNNWTYLEKESKRAIAAVGDSPAILAWALCDEPRRNLVGEMETFRQKFASWGARQPAVVVTMWPDSPTYAEQAGFETVCTDLYPFFSRGNPNGPNTPAASRSWYRRQTQATLRAAVKNGRTPWIMPQCFLDIWGPWKYDEQLNAVLLPGSILHWRQPTVGEIRWQVWSAAAAGVKGFFWFVFLPPPQDQPDAKPYVGPTFPPTLAVKEATPVGGPGGLLRPDGSETPECLAAAEAFASIRPLRSLLQDAAPLAEPCGTVSSPGWIGALRNATADRTFAALVNDDTDQQQTLKVTLSKPYRVRDLRSGNWLERSADNTVLVTLGPGDGTFLDVVAAAAE